MVDDDGGDGGVEGPKFLGEGVVVVADEGEHATDAVDSGGRSLPGRWFGRSCVGGWAEPSGAEGGDVDPQLRR